MMHYSDITHYMDMSNGLNLYKIQRVQFNLTVSDLSNNMEMPHRRSPLLS